MGSCNQRSSDLPLSQKDVISIFKLRIHDAEYSIENIKYTLLQKDEIQQLIEDPKGFCLKIFQMKGTSSPAVFLVSGAFYTQKQKNSGFLFIDAERTIWILDPSKWYLRPIRQQVMMTSVSSIKG